MHLFHQYFLGPKGGTNLADYLQGIRAEIAEFFSVLEDISSGTGDPNTLYKPEVLIRYEQCNSMKIPLIAGGLIDQPYIWLMEWAICQQEEQLYYAVREANMRQSSSDKRDLLTNAPQI